MSLQYQLRPFSYFSVPSFLRASEDTGRHGLLIGRPVIRVTHILLSSRRNTFIPLDDVNSPQGRGFITSPMGPLGKVSSGGRNALFV